MRVLPGLIKKPLQTSCQTASQTASRRPFGSTGEVPWLKGQEPLDFTITTSFLLLLAMPIVTNREGPMALFRLPMAPLRLCLSAHHGAVARGRARGASGGRVCSEALSPNKASAQANPPAPKVPRRFMRLALYRKYRK